MECAGNGQLVGHSNLKQRINIFNNVKDENNTLKKEKADAERLVAQQKKVIERLQANSGADKENACLLAKIDHEERLQVLPLACGADKRPSGRSFLDTESQACTSSDVARHSFLPCCCFGAC